MLGVDCFVGISLLMAIQEGNQYLSHYFNDLVKVFKAVLAEVVTDAFPRNVLQHHVEETLLTEILYHLHYVWVRKVLEDLDFLIASDETHLSL